MSPSSSEDSGEPKPPLVHPLGDDTSEKTDKVQQETIRTDLSPDKTPVPPQPMVQAELAGSSWQDEEEQEMTRLGVDWLESMWADPSLSGQNLQFMDEAIHNSPPARSMPEEGEEDINLSLGPSAVNNRSKATYTTPIMATRPHDREEWEIEMETALQKARLHRMSAAATKNQQLQQMVQDLQTQNQSWQERAKNLEENQQFMEIQILELQAALQKEQQEKKLTQQALQLARDTWPGTLIKE